jgi:hypothetical protein
MKTWIEILLQTLKLSVSCPKQLMPGKICMGKSEEKGRDGWQKALKTFPEGRAMPCTTGTGLRLNIYYSPARHEDTCL